MTRKLSTFFPKKESIYILMHKRPMLVIVKLRLQILVVGPTPP